MTIHDALEIAHHAQKFGIIPRTGGYEAFAAFAENRAACQMARQIALTLRKTITIKRVGRESTVRWPVEWPYTRGPTHTGIFTREDAEHLW